MLADKSEKYQPETPNLISISQVDRVKTRSVFNTTG